MRPLLLALTLGVLASPWANAACDTVKNIRAAGGGDFTSIGAAVAALPNPIPNNWCLNIDSSTYSEQVVIRGFTFSFSSDTLTLQSDPALVSTHAAVNPPALSTAAFVIQNASVTILNVAVISTTSVTYGIDASSAFVQLSSISINSGGSISFAGIALSSASSLSYSSVTVQGAHALTVAGKGTAVSFSTLTCNSATSFGLLLTAASSATVSNSLISNPGGFAAVVSGGGGHILTQSTFTANANSAALYLISSSNTVSQSYVFNGLSTGAFLDSGSFGNVILQSTVTGSFGAAALLMSGASSNTVLQSVLSNPTGIALFLTGGGLNTILQSTAASAGALAAFYLNSSSNVVSQSYLAGSASTGAFLDVGAINNTVSLSTMVGAPGLFALGGSSNTLTLDLFNSATNYAANLAAGGNTIRLSTLTASSRFAALYVASSSNAFVQDYVAAPSTAIFLDVSALNEFVSQSTAAGTPALLVAASSNSFSQDFLSSVSGYAAFVTGGGNRISQSTATSAGALAALYLNSSSNVVTQSYVAAAASTGVFLDAGSLNDTISQSTVTGTTSALLVLQASSVTVSQDFLLTPAGYAAFISGGGAHSVSLTTASSAGRFAAFYLNSSSSVVTQSYFSNPASTAAFLDVAAVNDAFALSTAASASGGAAFLLTGSSDALSQAVILNAPGTGLFVAGGSTNAFSSLLVSGSTAAQVSASTGAALAASVLTGSGSGSALWLSGGAVNLFLTSNTLTGGAQGAGVALAAGNNGLLSFTSTTIQGSPFGMTLATQAANASVVVASMTFQALSPGATAVQFLGGTFVSTFTSVFFADTTVGVNVRAAPLSPASQLTFRTPAGPRTGPGWAADPGALIFWPDAVTSGLPPGCGSGYNVKKDASTQFLSIQAAVNGLNKTLSGNACVVVRDALTYGEQVTVQGFANNNFQLQIMADPALALQPAVNPPAASTAAFQILNSSVAVLGFMLRPASPVSYGLTASSGNVTISSVNVDSGGNVAAAGIALSSFSALSYSSVTVQAAHGLSLTGTGASVSFSTFTSNSAAFDGLFANGATGAAFTQDFFANPGGTAVSLSGGGGHQMSLSSATSAAGLAALYVNSSSNAISQCVFTNAASTAVFLDVAAANDTILLSTAASASAAAAFVLGGSSNAVQQSVLSNPPGTGLLIAGSADTASFLAVSGSTAAAVAGSTGTALMRDVLAAGASGSALWLTGGSAGLTATSTTLNAGALGAGAVMDAGISGAVSLTSTTIVGPQFGLVLATQAAGASLSLSSMTFRSLPAGATAVHFLGGTFVSTFTSVDFSNTNVAVNVDARLLAAASQITMRTPTGVRTGPGWADDPSGVVFWADELTAGMPPGCGEGYGVKKDASQQFTTIQAAVNGLDKYLTANTCVVVRDSMTYAEQVTVQGFSNNGFQVQIMLDPAVSTQAVIAPPAASTAAFQVSNASVTVLNFMVRPSNPMPYGILASSPNVTLSSVNVDSGGKIGAAGIALSSANALSYSSVTVQAAHGLALTGAGASVSFSTAAASAAGVYALFLNGVSSASVSHGVFSNPLSTAAVLLGAGASTIAQSTITSAGAFAAVWMSGSFNSALVQSFAYAPSGIGAYLAGGSGNSISQSTAASSASPALFLAEASDSISGSVLVGPTAALVAGSTGTAIGASVLTSTSPAGAGLWLTQGSVGLSVSSSVIAGGSQTASVLLDPGGSGLLSLVLTTLSQARYGLSIATQTAGATLSITSVTFQNLLPGATAINFLGGAPVSTFSGVNFADSFPSINVNAAALGAAARLTMIGAFGVEAGPCFQDDPQGLVSWPGITACLLSPAPFTGVEPSSMTVNWGSTFPGGSFYYAQLSTQPFPNALASNITTVSFNTSAGFVGLTPNTLYFAQVSPDSLFGPFTQLGSTTTPILLFAPNAPGVTAVGISLVSWTWPVVAGAQGYKVYRASAPATLLASIAPNSFTDVGLATNTTSGVMVAAFNAGGVGPLSSPATAFTLAVPPSGSAVLAVNAASATISWTLNSNPSGTTAEVQRSTDNANFGDVLTAAATAFTDSGLQNCSTYYYRVRNQNGNGLPTGFDGAVQIQTVGLTPLPPAGLVASAQPGSTIGLSWTFSASTAIVAQYRLYFDSGTGVVSTAAPLMVFSSTETGWTTAVLPSSAAYTFLLRAKTVCGVEETAGVMARAPSLPALSPLRAAIRFPGAGQRIRGNSVSLVAELTSGTLAQIAKLIFQFRPTGALLWSNIATADFNHPNPVLAPPFVLHWDVSGLAPGLYDLRAVAQDFVGNQDSAPDSIVAQVLGILDPTFDVDENLDLTTNIITRRQVLSNAVASRVAASGSGPNDPVATILLPPGAVSAPGVTLTAVCNPVITTPTPSGFTFSHSSVRVSLNNGQSVLGAPATVTLSYPDPRDDPSRLLMLSLNEATGQWAQDLLSSVNGATLTVTGRTPHFSIFAIFASGSGPAANLGNVQAYPVPFKPNGGNPDEGKPFVQGDPTTGITFDNLPQNVRIKIYSLAGRLVATFETAAGQGQIQWDGRNMEGKEVSSGGYFAVISSPGQKSVVKRLMIIR